jgi:hypothetical protein
MFSQEKYITGSMKKSDKDHKSSTISEQKYVITETWQGHPSVQETHIQSSQCSGDNFIVKRTSESRSYNTEAVCHTNCIVDRPHLPEEPNSSQNVYREESVKSVLQEDPYLRNESGGIQRCQQIRGRNSGHLKYYTGQDPKLENNEGLLKNGEEFLLHTKTDGPDHIRETESDNQACKDKSSSVQGNRLAGDVSKLQLDGHKVVDPFDHTLIRQLLTTLGFPDAENNKCCVNLNVQVPQFKIGGTVILGKFLP